MLDPLLSVINCFLIIICIIYCFNYIYYSCFNVFVNRTESHFVYINLPVYKLTSINQSINHSIQEYSPKLTLPVGLSLFSVQDMWRLQFGLKIYPTWYSFPINCFQISVLYLIWSLRFTGSTSNISCHWGSMGDTFLLGSQVVGVKKIVSVAGSGETKHFCSHRDTLSFRYCRGC